MGDVTTFVSDADVGRCDEEDRRLLDALAGEKEEDSNSGNNNSSSNSSNNNSSEDNGFVGSEEEEAEEDGGKGKGVWVGLVGRFVVREVKKKPSSFSELLEKWTLMEDLTSFSFHSH